MPGSGNLKATCPLAWDIQSSRLGLLASMQMTEGEIAKRKITNRPIRAAEEEKDFLNGRLSMIERRSMA